MIIDLTPYRSDLPYPPVRQVRKDARFAVELMEAYSGGASELTTVLQYAYHSLRCKRKYAEVSRIMRGIFYVETIHLELVGDLVQRLGCDPQYLLSAGEKSVGWQPELVDYETSTAKMLLSDLAGEKLAAEYYHSMSRKTDQPEIAALLARLGKDEELHVRILTDLYRRTFRF